MCRAEGRGQGRGEAPGVCILDGQGQCETLRIDAEDQYFGREALKAREDSGPWLGEVPSFSVSEDPVSSKVDGMESSTLQAASSCG